MTYQFEFNRSSLTLLLVSVTLTGLTVFATGFVMGVAYNHNSNQTTVHATAQPVPAPQVPPPAPIRAPEPKPNPPAPDLTPARAVRQPETTRPGPYSVQLAAFSVAENADRAARDWSEYNPEVVTLPGKSTTLYALRFGAFGDRDQARAAAEHFYQQRGINGIVVRRTR